MSTLEECTCHISPPCAFCTSLSEEEVDIYESGGSKAVAEFRARPLEQRIFDAIAADIRGRKGVGDEWEQIDEEVMKEEIRPTWEKIISDEIKKFETTPKK